METVLIRQDLLLLLTILLMWLGAVSFLVSIVYNAFYMRKYQAYFYQLFKGRVWSEGGSFDCLSYRVIGSFIFNYMAWQCLLRFKFTDRRLAQQQNKTSNFVFARSGILEKDLLIF